MNLAQINKKILSIGQKEGGPFWFDKPARWWDKPKWRCINNHVSLMYINSEEHGSVCAACMTKVILTFPEDKDGEIIK